MRRSLVTLKGMLFSTGRWLGQAGNEHRSPVEAGAPRSSIAKLLVLAFVAAAAVVALVPVRASDHADPTALVYPESNITDLFFYPQGDQMILVFNIRRSLRNPKPYNLEPFVYEINIDFTTPVAFDSAEDRARYGGTINEPEKIHADAKIRLLFKDDVTFKEISYEGLNDTDKIETFVGVRDDPFVFPRFFDRNVIATVMKVPMTAFPAGKTDFILWATASRDGELIDHVGRSVRTQLPRFGFLNLLPPSEQTKKLMEEKEFWDGVYNFLRNKREAWSKAIADLVQFTFQIRPYDLVPDVMIYSSRFPVGYPNGRVLTDDVVAQACATGDCLLQEISFIEAKKGVWPRATMNDKAFLAEWPFLAEQWPDMQEAAPSTASIWPYVIAALLVLALVFWALVEIVRRLILWLWHRLRPKAAA